MSTGKIPVDRRVLKSAILDAPRGRTGMRHVSRTMLRLHIKVLGGHRLFRILPDLARVLPDLLLPAGQGVTSTFRGVSLKDPFFVEPFHLSGKPSPLASQSVKDSYQAKWLVKGNPYNSRIVSD